jgi:hypothetical protein
MSEEKRDDGREAAKKEWGFPRFAKDFPPDAELDALVVAFTKGDYATVREGAPKLAARTEDEAVKRAAETLRARIEPDPGSRILFAFAAALLVFLTIWWVTHDGPPEGVAPAKPQPTIERIH